ncbi:MAG: hypothetical protein EOO46_15090 [Flavobacterium sp.]|nr:MAG: hypothetical protein EOO46_15090 [Flavobacterium sp.]
MKKLLFAFFTLCFTTLSFAQTLLSSIDLDLKKPSSNHRSLHAVNAVNNEIFVFASDKEKLTAIKYSSFVFFKDSLSGNRPDKDFEQMSGYSFNEEGTPEVYWTRTDFKKIKSLSFDLKNRKTAENVYELPFEKELILSSFSENNSYYIMTVSKTEDELKLYVFQNGKMKERFIDFSGFKILDVKSNRLKFWSVFEENPLEKIQVDELNSLVYATSKAKFYAFNDKIIFTFDHNVTETQIFELNLKTYKVEEKKIAQQSLKTGTGQSNSYLSNNKLYQLKVNESELLVAVKNYNTGELINSFTTSKEEIIAHKNSPLFSQTGKQRQKEFKNTKKFLERLEESNIGISVYETRYNSFITIGGIKDVASTGGILLGLASGVGAVASGGSTVFMDEFMYDGVLQVNYFETHLDLKSEYLKKQQEILATDYVAQFLDQKKDISLASTFKFKDHYILGYYDTKEKKYVLRKFQDDFID